eukprot:15459277-Heterocapsa_arctica.AAC.1
MGGKVVHLIIIRDVERDLQQFVNLPTELVRHHVNARLLNALEPQVVDGPQVVLRSRHRLVTLQAVQVCDGVGVMRAPVGLKHLVDHAESGPAAEEPALLLRPVHRRGEF